MSVQVVTCEDTAEPNKTLQFRLIKTFQDISSDENAHTKTWLEVSQRYGVTFILHGGSLRIVESKNLLVQDSLPPPIRNNVDVIGLSADDSLLAIGTGSNVSLFETKSFVLQPTVASPRASFVVSKSGGVTSQLAWNPADTRLIAALSEDGTVILIRVLDNWSIEAVTANDPGFRCMSWSPKGKQLVVGGSNGIVQLKLDLKEAKKIPLPPGQEPVSIHWLSTLQFLVSFQPTSRDDLKIMLLTLSKTAPPLYKDFGDIFLSDDFTNTRVLSKHIPQWRLHLLGSSSSSDIIVASHDPSQPTSDLVVQEIEDRYRAALPLDHFCRGAGIYLGCSESVVINGDDLQACPLLVLLSQKGLVTLFRVVNEGYDSIHIPTPEPLKVVSAGVPAIVPPTSTVQPASGGPAFGNLNIGAAATKSLFGFTPSVTTTGGSSLFGTTSAPTSSFFSTPAKTVASVAPTGMIGAPNTNVGASAAKNLFGSLPTSAPAPAAFSFASSLPNQDIKTEDKKFPAFGQMLGAQSRSGGGDAPSLVPAPTSVPVQVKKEAPPPKVAPSAYEYKHLLDQLKQFHIRYNNFKKHHLLQSKIQSDAINQYFSKLDSQILRDLHKISDFARDIVETTNGQKEEVDALYMNMQNLFTKIEYGLIAAEKSKDSKYLLLLRAQPIDPVSLAKLTKVEKGYIYVRNQLKEARRHFYYQEQNLRPLQGSVSVDFIFQTIDNHAHIIQNLNRQAQEIRQRLAEQQIQLISSTANSHVTLDDIASGISHLKLKPSKQDENNILAKQQIIYSKDKISQLKRWAGHTLVTRVPVTGAIDPYLPIAQVRKIRLNPESFQDEIESQPSPVTSAAPVHQQNAKGSGLGFVSITPTEIGTSGTTLGVLSPTTTKSASSGTTTALTSQPSFFTSAASFFASSSAASASALTTQSQIKELPLPTVTSVPTSSVFQEAIGSTAAPHSTSTSIFGSSPFPAATTKPSFFGTMAPSAAKPVSIFGGSSASTTASTTPAFNFTSSQPLGSIFGSVQSTTDSKTPAAVATPAFAIPAGTAVSSATATSTAAVSSVFGTQLFGAKSVAVTTTTTSLFGSAPSASIFGAPKTTEPVSLFASSKSTDGSSAFGAPKLKEAIPAVDTASKSEVATEGATEASSAKTVQTSAGLTATVSPVATTSGSGTGTTLFGTKSGPLFGQPPVSSSLFGSAPLFGSGTSLFGTATTTSSAFGSSTSAFGSASIFGAAAQTAKTEATIATTATVTSLFGLPKPVAVSSEAPSVQVVSTAAPAFSPSSATPAEVTTTGLPASTVESPSILSGLLSSGPAVKPPEESVKAEPAVSETQAVTPTTSAIGSSSENTSSLFGSMSLTTSAPSLFGTTAPKSGTSIFGGVSSAPSTASIFGASSIPSTSASTLFGSAGSSSLFGAPATTSSLFGAAAATAATTTTSLFPAPTTTASLFGSPVSTAIATTTPASTLFGAPSNASIFGSTATTSTPSVFGSATPAAFGTAAIVSTANAAPSLFGTPATTVPSGLFGVPESKPAETSIFGGSPSIFGGAGANAPEAKQIFGSPAAVPTSSSQSVFGSPAFGSPGFGSQAATAAPGLFGSSAFGTTGGGIVKPAATAFGGVPTGSVFGGSTTATTTASGFGTTSPTSPAFGGGAVFGGSPAFGSTLKPSSFGSSSIFGGGSTTTGSTFGVIAGSGTQAPAATFGTATAFGSPQQQPQQTAFGGAATFGSPPAFGAQAQSPSLFGSPAFGASGTSAFGQQQQPNNAFGGGAVFGGSPAFGSTAKTATFGASNTSSIFGGGADNSNSTFGNLATSQPAFGSPQNTGGFGAAAQQQQPFGSFSSFGQAAPQPQPAFGGSSFGGGFSQQQQQQQQQPQQKTASFGGSSFSSWR